MAAVAVLAAKAAALILGVLTVTAYLTLLERRVLARFQIRVGPCRVGPWGLLQPLADGVKLLGKEQLRPDGADPVLFRAAPLLLLVPSFLVWALLPLGEGLQLVRVPSGVLLLLAVSSLGVYGIVAAGWASNSKYATLGALRAAAQVTGYEAALVLAVVAVVATAGTLDLEALVRAQEGRPLLLRQPLAFVIFLVAALAETNRTPFDLPEAESELTGGYHTEYSGMAFGVFYLAEYVNLLSVGTLAALLFLGGWHGPWRDGPHWLLAKALLTVLFFYWVRGTLPRLRPDQLSAFGWKVLVPLAALNVVATGAAKALLP